MVVWIALGLKHIPLHVVGYTNAKAIQDIQAQAIQDIQAEATQEVQVGVAEFQSSLSAKLLCENISGGTVEAFARDPIGASVDSVFKIFGK